MLLNSLYTIKEFEKKDEQIIATISIDPSHEIFTGHFPSQPVLPGVCLLEMLKDLINKGMNKPYLLSTAGNIKYLKVVDPKQNQLLTFEVKLIQDETSLKVVAVSAMEDGSVNFKFKGTFAC